MPSAFGRAKAMFAAIAAAMALPTVDARESARSKIGPYRSRGKGKGITTYARGRGSRGGNNAGRLHAHQGPQERLRRARGGWAGYGDHPRMTKRHGVEALQSGRRSFRDLASKSDN